MEEVVLVDAQDAPLGTMEKMEAHRRGLLHRAFSVFLFHPNGDMLIHRRAKEKYHSGGLWTNACCSHPRQGETTEEAAHRRMMEELGIDCSIDEKFSFIYRAELDKGLIEHELDHVFFGQFNGNLRPNPEEVMDWKFISTEELEAKLAAHPEKFTEWFKIALDEMRKRSMLQGS
jgi:isopentenyl-diphosphate delta-isomerase